ncbi:phosphatase PAP2 family protein [Cellulophaga baltica]|uniref:phosphatase PAP2 family protein n=1 Tax=Cellulophaga TaxID=104264 RepID=UPI001C065A78|nr:MULTISPECIES: phosphatase PAP2 family protein [Cellulophaga]MBU2995006.1 phosphatase PAP2 family protein [Cellulophaga baltica]MDO6766401.1 phosphatase PAP2 family protein [Cellulophaga sp. 1_MG-2023]
MLDKLLAWDRETFIYLNSLGIEQYDYMWSFATKLLTWTPLYIFILFLLVYKQTKKRALFKVGITVSLLLFILALTKYSKMYFERLRPSSDPTLNKIIRVINTSQEFSFISGHAAFSFSLTTIAVLFLKDKIKWIWFLYLWPVFLSFSRIYVGVHYPLDLIMGGLTGVLVARLFFGVYKRLQHSA